MPFSPSSPPLVKRSPALSAAQPRRLVRVRVLPVRSGLPPSSVLAGRSWAPENRRLWAKTRCKGPKRASSAAR